jgi:hypothetical protein
VEKIMKTRTFILALATGVAIASGPQLAHACIGDACSFITFGAGSTVDNAHRTNAVVVGLCAIVARGDCGPSPRIEELNIQPMQRKELPPGLRSVFLRTAKLIPNQSTPGPKPMDKTLVDKVTVTNGGQVPLKVVILDMGKVDIGRTPNYETGSVDIKLRNGVAKYHWEAFTPGAVEPCQVVHDETKSAITAQCQRPKVPDAAHQVVTRPVSADSGLRWAEQCRTDGTGGPTACCERQRKAEPYCMQQPQDRSSSADCAAAETLCRQSQRTSLKPSGR